MSEEKKEPKKLIIALSIGIPLAVAALFGIKIPGYDMSFLPPIYATINGITAILLLGALVAIKSGNTNVHRKLMFVCMVCSLLFLLLYITYHITSASTSFGGEGAIQYVYYFILISHIVLSIVVIPLVLFTFVKGFYGNYTAHKKWAKWAFPIWLYVAISGVAVYWMISPYYV